MTTLTWPIKTSLLRYVRGMADGAVAVRGGAVEHDGAFHFPGESSSEDEHRFTGTVTMQGHGGMLALDFREPWLRREAHGWSLSIADPDAATGRVRLATLRGLDRHADGTLRGSGTALTADGADLFFGPYENGTPFDDPVVVP